MRTLQLSTLTIIIIIPLILILSLFASACGAEQPEQSAQAVETTAEILSPYPGTVVLSRTFVVAWYDETTQIEPLLIESDEPLSAGVYVQTKVMCDSTAEVYTEDGFVGTVNSGNLYTLGDFGAATIIYEIVPSGNCELLARLKIELSDGQVITAPIVGSEADADNYTVTEMFFVPYRIFLPVVLKMSR